jgi:hypothetical protein
VVGGTPNNYSTGMTVVFSGGGGSGAAASIVANSTAITGITFSARGTGYTSAPTATVGQPIANVTISNGFSSGTFTYLNTTVGTTNHVITTTYASGDSGLSGDTTNATIAVVPGAAAGLIMVTNPAPTAQAGVAFTQQPVVRIVDQFTNVVSQSNVTVNASIAVGNTNSLEGVRGIQTLANGVSTFTNLAIGGAPGDRTLRFATTNFAGTVTSTVVNVGVGPAAAITLLEEPSQVPAGDKITKASRRGGRAAQCPCDGFAGRAWW